MYMMYVYDVCICICKCMYMMYVDVCIPWRENIHDDSNQHIQFQKIIHMSSEVVVVGGGGMCVCVCM